MEEKRLKAQGLNEFRILTEYEYSRAQIAIEWIARAEKPIAEIGGRPIKGCDFQALIYDLNRCISLSGERVRAFVMPDKARGFCCYGFYRYRWAVEALLFLWGEKSGPFRSHSLWMQGLIFGYSPGAIEKFILSASGAQESKLHCDPCTDLYRRRRVEIYGTLALLVRRRNNRNGRCRRSD